MYRLTILQIKNNFQGYKFNNGSSTNSFSIFKNNGWIFIMNEFENSNLSDIELNQIKGGVIEEHIILQAQVIEVIFPNL